MKKAILKEANVEKIKQFEIDYFQNNYGKVFEIFHEIDFAPILKYEAYILNCLDRILRHKQ